MLLIQWLLLPLQMWLWHPLGMGMPSMLLPPVSGHTAQPQGANRMHQARSNSVADGASHTVHLEACLCSWFPEDHGCGLVGFVYLRAWGVPRAAVDLKARRVSEIPAPVFEVQWVPETARREAEA